LTINFNSTGCIDSCNDENNSYTINGQMEFKFSAGQPDGNQPPFDNYKVCTFKQGKSGQLADEECKFIGDLRTYIKLHGETVHIVGKADLKYIDFTNG
jgi:hypothetical protein